MERPFLLYGSESVRNSWRRDPVQTLDECVVQFAPLTPEAHAEALLIAYRHIERSGLAGLFWEFSDKQLTPLHFLNYFAAGQGRAAFLVMKQGKLCGFMMLASFDGNRRCSLGGWIAPAYRGVNSHWIMRQALCYCHATLNIERVFASTPWRHAHELLIRSGMRMIGRAEGYFSRRDKGMDLMMHASERVPFLNDYYKHLVNSLGADDDTARGIMTQHYGKA